MKIVERNVSELKKSEYNPRKLSSKERTDIRRSLEKFGFVVPIVVNIHQKRKNVVIGGHQRLEIWHDDMGKEVIPTVEVKLDEDREKELNIRLNKNSGEWDESLLSEYFDENELVEWGFSFDELKISGEPLKSLGGDADFEIPKMEAKLYEHHDYIVMVFENMHDFLHALNYFEIRKVDSSLSSKTRKIGVGRVIDGKKAMEKIQNVKSNSKQRKK